MLRAVCGDVGNGLFHVRHGLHGYNGFKIFGAPIIVIGRFCVRIGFDDLRIAANFAPRFAQIFENGCEMRPQNSAIDQERLGRAANARPPHFCVENKRARLAEIGG
jgi:hypothetical protein